MSIVEGVGCAVGLLEKAGTFLSRTLGSTCRCHPWEPTLDKERYT